MFPGIDLELLEDVSPDCLHVIPVLNDTVIHWVGQLEDALEFLLKSHNDHRFVSNHSELAHLAV